MTGRKPAHPGGKVRMGRMSRQDHLRAQRKARIRKQRPKSKQKRCPVKPAASRKTVRRAAEIAPAVAKQKEKEILCKTVKNEEPAKRTAQVGEIPNTRRRGGIN